MNGLIRKHHLVGEVLIRYAIIVLWLLSNERNGHTRKILAADYAYNRGCNGPLPTLYKCT